MSHIKDRLKQYKDKYSDCYKYAGVALQILKTQKSRGNHQSTCRKKLLVSG